MSETFFWHDYETFGVSPRSDRPAQFAGLRTDADFEPVEEPVSFYCRPPADYVPRPEAMLITGITPDDAEREGAREAEFAARVFEELARPGTCGVGYNSLRFDDEVSRFLFWRNFFPPYEREYANGNSRWDLIDVARLCYAVRPDGVEWPLHDSGKPSFRLEDLAGANGIAHGRAHEALSDVEATLGLARRLRTAQPRLIDYCLGLRDRRNAERLLNPISRQPCVHVSSRFGADRGCLAVVLPLAQHPRIQKQIIVFDLAADPLPLLESDPELLRDLVFTPTADLPEGFERVPLKTVATNKCPVVAPLSVLRDADHDRIALDLERCLANARTLAADPTLAQRVQAVFDAPFDGGEPPAEEDLYGGFASREDGYRLADVRATPPHELGTRDFGLSDHRLRAMLPRYQARNYPDTLDSEATDRWFLHCRESWRQIDEDSGLPAGQDALARVGALRDGADGQQLALLDRYEAWVRERASDLAISL
ncbi:MAG: exodeoxyribonuclease I [Pseudomonadota bacterium]